MVSTLQIHRVVKFVGSRIPGHKQPVARIKFIVELEIDIVEIKLQREIVAFHKTVENLIGIGPPHR